MQYVPASDELFVKEAAERYRRFREARAELAKLSAEVLSLADALQESLTVPYPAKTKEASRPQPRRGAKSDGRTTKNQGGASREEGDPGIDKAGGSSSVDGGSKEGG